VIRLDCPCGNSCEFPEETVTIRCEDCGRSRRVVWFSGPGAYEAWRRWSTWQAGRVLHGMQEWQMPESSARAR
jgi:hypothetical protein